MKAVFLILLSVFFVSCSTSPETLFRLIPPTQSGLDFVNTVEERDSINILNVQYMYHGAAVAIGDFNHDRRMDIFFSGNMVSNKLYLNQGDLKFKDVSADAGIQDNGKWNSGVALADVNGDGWLDIYVCATIHDDPAKRANSLYIHQGLNDSGIPVFVEQAAQYGVANTGYSQNAAFLDYDRDGDLDLYVLTNLESDKIPSNYRPRIVDGSALNNDRLYRNNGNNTFTDVTIEAGIVYEGYGLGIGIADINGDGWPDIYIGNDYVSNDVLYINNRDGTFTNEIRKRLKHQSLFSMGIDISDVDNDLNLDIITLDMLPENNLRRKTVSGAGATYYTYINNVEYDYEFQYMRNMLHANNGDGTFREVGQMAGVHQTEWSWSSLFADVDNDGFRDLLITNGFPKDVTDKDYVMFKRDVGAFNHQRSLIDSIPVLKVPNYAFRNNGDFNFQDMTTEWGLRRPSFSNGAAFADLDNDGDLDYVVNNINDPAFLYENTLYTSDSAHRENNYLRVRLIGSDKNRSGLGARVEIRYKGKKQLQDFSAYRGYLSTVEDVVHFGLGADTKVDTLNVLWPDGRFQQLTNVAGNRTMEIRYSDARAVVKPEASHPFQLYKEVSSSLKLNYKHREWDKIDYYRQRTLPHKFSQSGPGMAVGDTNGDGLEDLVIGGSSLYNTTVLIQNRDGSFGSTEITKGTLNKSEDEGLLLVDVDSDGDLDLYVVSGSYEGEAGEDRYQDRLYLNDGNGRYTLSELPNTISSGSCVRAADFDRDGDLDLFVGGRVVAGSYPLPPDSYLLRNDKGIFTDVTDQVSPGLRKIGMVTDALWTDFDNDGLVDLMVVGEFMPVMPLRNTGDKLLMVTNSGLQNFSGWWNSIVAADMDRDGDIDYVAGNLGLNNYYGVTANTPLRVYAKDFDGNGSIDAVLSCYFKSEDGIKREYPTHFWDELNGQSPKFRNQFSSYKQYGSTSLENLLKPYDTTGMVHLSVNYTASAFIENKGNSVFELTALPRAAQVSPVNGVVITDANADMIPDILLIGNDYGNEVFSGRLDAGTGLLLIGTDSLRFKPVSTIHSGLKVDGDAKSLVKLNSATGAELVVASQNLDSLRVFKSSVANSSKLFTPATGDQYAMLEYADGKTQRVEFYHGSGYLGQSSRSIRVPSTVVKLRIYDAKGSERVVAQHQLATLSR